MKTISILLACLALAKTLAFQNGDAGWKALSPFLIRSRVIHEKNPLSELFMSQRKSDSSGSLLSSSSFLSHVMLKVPSVDETVEYWTQQQGASIRISRPVPETDEDGDPQTYADGSKPAKLASAFLEFGNAVAVTEDSNPVTSFALEIVGTKETQSYSIGNGISYLGISMLLKYKMNQPSGLLNVIQKGTPPPGIKLNEPQPDRDVNGIAIQSVASAPGDYLARLALHTQQLAETADFYTSVLGMTIKAQDDTTLCLRYEPENNLDDDDTKDDENNSNNPQTIQTKGVPTTLVFDLLGGGETELDKGDCFDHLAILTYASIDELHERITSNTNSATTPIFMKPTEMFGKSVMGVMDPNGYKIVIASI